MGAMTHATREQLSFRLAELTQAYEDKKAQNLKLDMSRGKPGADQLDLSVEMLDCVGAASGYKTPGGVDVRNYGLLEGIPEARALFAEIFDLPAELVLVGGNSSLNLMFDYVAMAHAQGVCGGRPWSEGAKFLCPSPGYDRHFAITEHCGIEMIPVPMTPSGPDMEAVERLVADPLVKGMWCVPMYSNPDGITYSDETVRRLASMRCAAADFRIVWDNAYCLHHLYDTPDHLLNLYRAAQACGNEDRVVTFVSTSKVSFPGGGVAALASSPANIAQIQKRWSLATIGYDKINMLRHVRYFGSLEGIQAHMKRHAALLRPKFQTVLDALDRHLGGKDIAQWNQPRGGYFVSVHLMEGCAAETLRLLAEAGVVMTPAGATYPYGKDPHDSIVRIAPTFPPVAELAEAMELFCICAELACGRKLLAIRKAG